MPVPPLFTEDLDSILEATRSYWDEARRESIFVTGGTGFFGMWLVESFCHINRELGLNAKMTILTRAPQKFREKAPHLTEDAAIHLQQGDVRNFEFPDGKYKFVIHAGATPSRHVKPMEMFYTIVDGTRRALEFALQSGSSRFLFVSSGAVYGKQPDHLDRISEEYCGAPNLAASASAYGEGKRVGELLCEMMSEGTPLSCRIARCFAFIGPHLPLESEFAAASFLKSAIQKRPIEITGNPNTVRSYQYASDLATWLWTLVLTSRPISIINVGADNPVTLKELADEISNATASQVNIPVADPKSTCNRYMPATNRASDILGLNNTVPLRMAIQKTITWLNDSRSI